MVEGDEDPKLIIPIKIGKLKYERHFLNPKEKIFAFENNGKIFYFCEAV